MLIPGCDTVALDWKKIDRNLTKVAPIEKADIHSLKVYVILICVHLLIMIVFDRAAAEERFECLSQL